MPWAAFSRPQFQGFRTGVFAGRGGRNLAQNPVFVRFEQAWEFNDDIQPLFPVPACVLFAQAGDSGDLPPNVRRASGQLPHRDATPAEADRWLAWRDSPWPEIGDVDAAASPYRERFRNGATLFPRVLCLVALAPAGPLGAHPQAPLVESRSSSHAPWNSVAPLSGNVERRFLRPAYLGESVAPFRLLEPPLAVIPWDRESGLLDAAAARGAGCLHLATWMATAEQLWNEHRRSERLSFAGQLDYYGKLRAQFPVPPLRVVYSASGTYMAAAIVTDAESVVENSLYWAAVRDYSEARYLVAVLTSEATRRRIASLQARGQWGARHFHRVMWTLPIAEFNAANPLHAALVTAGHHAETVAAQVPLKETTYFITARRQIRTALAEDGVAGEIDGLVEDLLGGAPAVENE